MGLEKTDFITAYNNDKYLKVAETKGITWDLLSQIHDDFEGKWNQYDRIRLELVNELYADAPDEVWIVYGRTKKPTHLIEKIVRKVGKEDKASYQGINVSNYESILTDIIAVRILTLKKEDWKQVDTHIKAHFSKYMQKPIAYVCYGDRDVFSDAIKTDYTNKGYRSQHYIVDYRGIPCEIQVRTLSEEVFGEFDHHIHYPYKTDNKFLDRYSHIVSKITSELDDLISTAFELDDDNLEMLGRCYAGDIYVDWKNKKFGNIETDSDAQNSKSRDEIHEENAVMYAKEHLMRRKE